MQSQVDDPLQSRCEDDVELMSKVEVVPKKSQCKAELQLQTQPNEPERKPKRKT